MGLEKVRVDYSVQYSPLWFPKHVKVRIFRSCCSVFSLSVSFTSSVRTKGAREQTKNPIFVYKGDG